MLFRFIEKRINPNEPLLGANILVLKLGGLMLPDNSKFNIVSYILFASFTFFVFAEYVEVWALRDDVHLVLSNFSVSLQSTMCWLKHFSFLFYQKKWRAVLKYVTDADIEERAHEDVARKKIVAGYTKYCKTLTYIYWSFVFININSIIATPLIHCVFRPDYWKSIQNGTVPFPHVFSTWVPFDKNASPQRWFAFLWHALVGYLGALIVSGFDINVMVLMKFFEKKFELLKCKCSLILENENDISDELFYERIKNSHRTHLLLMKHAKIFNSLLSPIMFVYVLICSVLICASANTVTGASMTILDKMENSQIFLFDMAQLFMFCYHSNKVFYKSTEVSYGPYESYWWSTDVRQQKIILIFTEQLRKPFIFTAGPFTALTMNTCIKILKGAYGYYTLLRD